MKNKKLKIKLFACMLLIALGMSSCIQVQTAPVMISGSGSAPRSDDKRDCTFYRIGQHYYVGFRATYVCKIEPICISFGVLHGKEKHALYSTIEREGKEESLYILLSAEMARKCLGIRIDEPSADVPRLIRAADWDASAAQVCASRKAAKYTKISVRSRSSFDEASAYCAVNDGRLVAYLPLRMGWSAVYKMPLAAVLWLGVDIPCSLALNTAVIAGYAVIAPFDAVLQALPQKMESVEPVAPIEPAV